MNIDDQPANISEEVMKTAMTALIRDLTPAATDQQTTVAKMFDHWHPDLSDAYIYGYTTAVLGGARGKDITTKAGMGVSYALTRSTNPAMRELAADLLAKASALAYASLNESFHQAGEDPSFTAICCAECHTGHYRDDLPADCKGDAPTSRWCCAQCGHRLALSDLVLEPDQDWAVNGHTLGYITPLAPETA